MNRHLLRTSLIIVAGLLPQAALPQASLPPPGGNDPVVVTVRLRLSKIAGLDTVDESFRAYGYLNATWTDPRVVSPVADGEPTSILYEDAAVAGQLGVRIWWPTLEFSNATQPREISSRTLEVDRESGFVTYDERFHATFGSPMEFHQYPFDTQSIAIIVETFAYTMDDVVFDENSAFVVDPSANDQLAEWQILESKRNVAASQLFQESDGASDSLVDTRYARFTAQLTVRREPGYFIWQVFLPLFLIIATSWAVFWISDFGNQLSTASTLMLTVVAFNFYVSTLLPRLPYNTFIETVIISGYVVIFLVIIAVIVEHRARRAEKSAAADRFVAICRWSFPALYLASMLTLAIAFLA